MNDLRLTCSPLVSQKFYEMINGKGFDYSACTDRISECVWEMVNTDIEDYPNEDFAYDMIEAIEDYGINKKYFSVEIIAI